MNKSQQGRLFSPELTELLRSQIIFDENILYFENAGGSLTLKSCCDAASELNAIPDFAGRPTPEGKWLGEEQEKGLADAMLLFGAKSGALLAELTVSKAIFTVIGTILASCPKGNVVTTELDHPASYDGCRYYGNMYGMEFRSAPIDMASGSVDVDALLKLIDKNTVLLSVIHASNITGAHVDMKRLVKEARAINPDIYIVADSTQHVPHAVMDVEELGIDATGFAPYKLLGKRGLGLAWVSERVASLPHPRFLDGAVNDWDLGGYEPAGIVGISRVVDYICQIGSYYSDSPDRRTLIVEGMKAIELHERALMYRMIHGSEKCRGVKDIPGVTLHFVEDLTRRDAILPMTFSGMDADEVMEKYFAAGIYVFNRSASSIMSKRVLDGIGLPVIVRISPMHYHTVEEIDRFLAVTEDIVAGRI